MVLNELKVKNSLLEDLGFKESEPYEGYYAGIDGDDLVVTDCETAILFRNLEEGDLEKLFKDFVNGEFDVEDFDEIVDEYPDIDIEDMYIGEYLTFWV